MISNYLDFLKSDAFLAPLGIPTGTELDFSVLGQGEYNLNYVFIHPLTIEEDELPYRLLCNEYPEAKA